MGYSCTLHLVDEEAIRTKFIPRLLGTAAKAPPPPPPPPTSFWQRWWRREEPGLGLGLGLEPAMTMAIDRHCRDADRQFRRARVSLTKRDPGTAAEYVCELAILYASAELPFTWSGNVALSLWSQCQPSGAPEMPLGLVMSDEEG